MLLSLNIKNFAVVTQLDLEFGPGMNVLTGETGAGKSILVDALGLILGDRASPNIIRKGCLQAEITTAFDLTKLPAAFEFLQTANLATPEQECIIRRVVTKEGRSRAFINGTLVTATQLKELGKLLLTVHAQHEHQNLLTSNHQRELLDQYAKNSKLLAIVQTCYQEVKTLQKLLDTAIATQSQDSKSELLRYHLQELNELNLTAEECANITAQHKCLAQSADSLQLLQELDELLNNEATSPHTQLGLMHTKASQLSQAEPKACNLVPSIKQTIDVLSEVKTELATLLDSLELDPEKLAVVEGRLGLLHKYARKHKVTIEDLYSFMQKTTAELNELTGIEQDIAKLKTELKTANADYITAAQKLHNSRTTAAEKLSSEIVTKLKTLAMPKAHFAIDVTANTDTVTPHGFDQINFLVAPNPGLELGSLKKIASGGELSRISLAIQVIASLTVRPPTLIFDEVDTGISGQTAEIVGQLLKALAKKAQVLCVTHLPQVAALGDTHFQVSKNQADTTHTNIVKLDTNQRVAEIARMIGGIEVTPEAEKLAAVMLTD